MTLHIYNTLTRKIEDFKPLVAGKVTMYVCGPTVYGGAHVGHGMSSLVFDIVRRYLEYRGYGVRHAMNYTDVDDKIIQRANQERQPPLELAERYIGEYDQQLKVLNVLPATVYPRATGEIPYIIDMVARLLENESAYIVDGSVYYRVEKDEDYGKLSGRRLEDMQAGARIDVDERKEHPMDFAVWKSAKPGEPSWDSPWGPGRPGWHIECSAMVFKHLGRTIDIHAGGKDLIFPHHENEIAQSEAYSGRKFVNFWLHNGFVNINQEKMSKSLRNFFTIRDILDQYDAEIVRLFLLSTHYRSPIDFSDANLKDARAGLDRFYTMKEGTLKFLAGKKPPQVKPQEVIEVADRQLYEKILNLPKSFDEGMDDDFNTAFAIGLI